jgi:hypothetical protein
MKPKRFQSALENKLVNLNKDRDKLIRKRVAKLVFGASIVRVFKPGTSKKLIPFLVRIKIDQFRKLKSESGFKKWFQRKSRDIAEIIKRDVNEHAHAPKILALYCRALLNECWYVLSKKEFKRIEKLLFVPIDSYVIKALKGLKGCAECEVLKDIKSMADFKPKTFMNIQEMLKGASEKTKIPRIVFDYVWGEKIKGQREKRNGS